MNIIQQWNSLTGTQQQEFIRNCILKAARNEFGLSSLYQHGHSVDEFISDVWIALTENRLTSENVERENIKREQAGKAPITLVSMIYKTVRAVMTTIIKHDWQADNRDGGELDTEQHTGTDTTADIITKLDFENFLAGLDGKSKKICVMRIEGYAEHDIGIAIGISASAVHKRIEKIRKEFAKQA